MKQVVTFATDGSVQGLQVKPGKGFDLRKLGHAAIKRSSEIVWNEETQRWTVCVLDPRAREALTGSANGHSALTWEQSQRATGKLCLPSGTWITPPNNVLEFPEYDDAVAVEIAVLDGLRKRGLLN